MDIGDKLGMYLVQYCTLNSVAIYTEKLDQKTLRELVFDEKSGVMRNLHHVIASREPPLMVASILTTNFISEPTQTNPMR